MSGHFLLVHSDGNVGPLGLPFDPLCPVMLDVGGEVVHPVSDGALPDEAAVAFALGVVGGHVHARVVAERVDVQVGLELRDLKFKY